VSDENRQHEIREAYKAYAKAKADRVYLEHFRKSKKALLMKQFEPDYPTAAAQEREAYAHPEYIELLKGLQAATQIEEETRYRLKMYELSFEEWRTRQANKRADRQRYNA